MKVSVKVRLRTIGKPHSGEPAYEGRPEASRRTPSTMGSVRSVDIYHHKLSRKARVDEGIRTGNKIWHPANTLVKTNNQSLVNNETQVKETHETGKMTDHPPPSTLHCSGTRLVAQTITPPIRTIDSDIGNQNLSISVNVSQ